MRTGMPTKAGAMNSGQIEYRILVVEDVPDIQRLIVQLLQDQGAEVLIADDGRAAVERVREAQRSGRPIHCVLMDMKMPVLGGCEAASQMRRDGYRGGIVAVTGWVVPGHRQQCLEAGCNDYLAKPFRAEVLLSITRKWCRPETAALSDGHWPDEAPPDP